MNSDERSSAAFRLWARILQATPADHPHRTAWLGNLGHTLQKRFEHTAVAADIDDALRAYAEAAQVDSARPWLRINAARVAAHVAEQNNDPAGAADLLETAVRVPPELAPRRLRRLRRADQQHQIAGIAGLPPASSSCTITRSRP